MNDVLKSAAREFIPVITGHVAETLIDAEECPVSGYMAHPDGRLFEGAAENPLIFLFGSQRISHFHFSPLHGPDHRICSILKHIRQHPYHL
jgi:hypothetical protein